MYIVPTCIHTWQFTGRDSRVVISRMLVTQASMVDRLRLVVGSHVCSLEWYELTVDDMLWSTTGNEALVLRR